MPGLATAPPEQLQLKEDEQKPEGSSEKPETESELSEGLDEPGDQKTV